MKRTKIKKWSLLVLLTLITVSIVSCIGVKSQIKQHNGGNTERIDQSIFKTTTYPLAIKNINILSTDCTKILDSLTVLVKNGRIIDISKNAVITSEYEVIDGTGQYLIPGLADTHVHLRDNKNDLLLFLANGVTHVSEMFGNENHLKWRKQAEDGALSPKIYVASRKLGSEKGLMLKIRSWFGSRPNFTTVKKAQKVVRKYKEEGYDAIKLSSFLNPEIYKAIVDEAKKQNIPTIGHLSLDVGLERFYTSGQSQLAHIEEIAKNVMSEFGGLGYDNTEEFLIYLKKNVDSIAIRLKESNTVVSSTIWLMESLPKQNFDTSNFLKTIELEYQNPGQIEGSRLARGWLPGNNSYENMAIKNDPEIIKKSKLFWETYVESIFIVTKALADNNVTITTGTDANGTGVVPGFSIHDELELLNKIGLSNTQVLYAATIAPAKWMQSDAGKIEIGYRADLVLLAKNPLEDIKNTRSINAVITNGKLLDRIELDKILQLIKETNNKSREKSIDEFIKNKD